MLINRIMKSIKKTNNVILESLFFTIILTGCSAGMMYLTGMAYITIIYCIKKYKIPDREIDQNLSNWHNMLILMWDQLTNYNGTTITYDVIGNPLSYYNGSSYTFTWQNGRELASTVLTVEYWILREMGMNMVFRFID